MKRIYILIAVTACACLAGCAREVPPRGEEVEISPGKFITISRVDRSHDDNGSLGGEVYSALFIPWHGTSVLFKSSDIPVSLREHDNTLYLIGFDRETDFQKCRFTYQKLNGTIFKKIAPSEYPKEIATQNMWFSSRHSKGTDGEPIDNVELTRELNVSSGYFFHTLTAKLWVHLETGKQYWEQGDIDMNTTRSIWNDYIRKHKPVALPTIIKEDKKEDG